MRSRKHCSRPLLAAVVLAASAGGAGSEATRRLTITVDDLPVGPPGAHSTVEQETITDRLVDVLRSHQVPAIGFVNENKLEVDGVVDPARVALLQRWLDAGLELGNHGHGHLDLHRVEPREWTADVLRGERVLRPLLAARGVAPRYFRHPYLHTGRSLEVKEETTRFLAEHSYQVAPVTMDNQEWIFGGAYARAGGEAERQQIGGAYVAYMRETAACCEERSRRIAGREIPQVLLIHASALNAD